MYRHVRISSLDDIDFDVLFEASLSRMDAGTFKWPDGINTKAKKKKHIKDMFTLISSQPSFVGVKGMIDDLTVCVLVGTYFESRFISSLSLFRDDVNGSRAYIYNPEFVKTFSDFMNENGFTECVSFMVDGSSIKNTVHTNYGITDSDYRKHSGNNDSFVIKLKD